MKSHEYEFKSRDLARLLAWPLATVALFAAATHLVTLAGLLPKPRPMLDLDRTIITHQVEASRARQDASIVLLGDSSCLMNVDAVELGRLLGQPVLNLGTLSYLDLSASAELLRQYAQANPGKLRAMVILQHPEALRRPAPQEYHVNLLRHLLDGTDFGPRETFHGKVMQVLGLEAWQNRVLARALPAPLPGAFRQRYGFATDLDRQLTAKRGSLLDPDVQPLRGSAEYRLAPTLERVSRDFRAAVPEGTKLFAGITPVPANFAGRSYPAKRDEMLATWGQWLRADATLTNLPPTLPDDRFVKTTHLNEAGVREFTEALAGALAPNLR